MARARKARAAVVDPRPAPATSGANFEGPALSEAGRPPAQVEEPVTVVRGLELEVSGRELGVRLSDRIRWHRERGDALLAQIKKLGEVEREAGADLAVFGRYDSPRDTLENKLREHQERAAFLAFVRDHVDADRIYRLGSMDLRMTEILPEKVW